MSETHAMGMADPSISIPDDNPTSSPLAKLSAANRALAQANTIIEVKQIMDVAEAARTYARAAKLGLEAMNSAAEVKIKAEYKLGTFLNVLAEQSKPNPNGQNQYTEVQVQAGLEPQSTQYRSALIENNIASTTARRCQTVAKILTPEEIEETISETKASGDKELTSSLVQRKAQELKRQQHAASMAAAPQLPNGKYRVIYADPPWKYNNSGVIVTDTGAEVYPRALKHYPDMTIAELCEMGATVKDMAEDNAVLFLWVTSPLLEESFEVIRSWGFKYKTSFVWDKIAHNFGHYNSVRHEFLLVCTRGSCTPDIPTLYDSVVSIQRTEHSVKPEEFRRMIDDLYTYGQRVELFARRPVDGWEVWGNQANG